MENNNNFKVSSGKSAVKLGHREGGGREMLILSKQKETLALEIEMIEREDDSRFMYMSELICMCVNRKLK